MRQSSFLVPESNNFWRKPDWGLERMDWGAIAARGSLIKRATNQCPLNTGFERMQSVHELFMAD